MKKRIFIIALVLGVYFGGSQAVNANDANWQGKVTDIAVFMGS